MKDKFLAFFAVIVLVIVGAALPAKADTHVGVVIGGPGYYGSYGYRGYYHGYYPGYYYPGYYPGWGYPDYYVAPPPVVYAPPPPAVVIPQSIAADQTSPTYIDELGRTCRQFQSAGDYNGKACLQPDGAWRIVP